VTRFERSLEGIFAMISKDPGVTELFADSLLHDWPGTLGGVFALALLSISVSID